MSDELDDDLFDFEIHECRKCGEEYVVEDLYKGMCDACHDDVEFNMIRSM